MLVLAAGVFGGPLKASGTVEIIVETARGLEFGKVVMGETEVREKDLRCV